MAWNELTGNWRKLEAQTEKRKELPRKEWSPIYMGNREYLCSHCALERREHINGVYCPEWRLRQLDGDR